MLRHYMRLCVGAAVLAGLAPFVFTPAAEPETPKLETYSGKVVAIQGLLEKAGARLDRDAAATWFALITDDGKVYPLVKDDGARMFFKDPRLLDRPMRLTGKLLTEAHFLQVVKVHSVKKGQLYEVFYWCEVCAIKRFENKDCDCCGAPMELREKLVKSP